MKKAKSDAGESATYPGLLRGYLDGRLSRRAFIGGLAALGAGLPAAYSLAERLAPSGAAQRVSGRGAKLLCEVLRAEKVEYIFGTPGDTTVELLDALLDYPDLKFILARHEGPALAMADGYAQASGRTGVVSVHTSAGSFNILGNLFNSFATLTPLVVLAGDLETEALNRTGLLQYPGLERLPEKITKFSWRANRVRELAELAARAFRLARAAPQGPVFVVCPADLMAQTGEAEIYPPVEKLPEAGPDRKKIEELADMLASAKQPVILAGQEVGKWGAEAELAELARALSIPVAVTFKNEPNYGNSAPMFIGNHCANCHGLLGIGPSRGPYWGEMDLLINVGDSRMLAEYHFVENPLPSSPRLAYIGLDPAAARDRNYRLVLISDVKQALQELLAAVRARAKDRGEMRPLPAHEMPELQGWDASPIHPARLIKELDGLLDKDATVVAEAVTAELFLNDFLTFGPGSRKLIMTAGGYLGWGVGALIGAKFARPDKQAVLLVGDGSFTFGEMGLWTAARHRVGSIIVIFNNYSYQIERWRLDRVGGRAAAEGKYIGCYLGAPKIDYPALARAYGLEGEQIKSPSEIGPAFERARAASARGVTYIIDAAVLPFGRGAAHNEWFQEIYPAV